MENKFYKIKVGIEEFQVKEADIPRIVEAMKTGNMVQLESGLFRGNAILAVCRDFEKEIQLALSAPTKETPEQIEDKEKKEKLKEKRLKCEICNHTGWVEGKRRDGSVAMFPCECQVI
jgi:hypothetical protein